MAKTQVDRKGRKRIKCLECGEWFHTLAPHLGRKHGMSVEEYLDKHTEPGQKPPPTISVYASKEIDRSRKNRKRPTIKTEEHTDEEVEKLDIGGWEVAIRPNDSMHTFAKDHIPAHDEHWEPDNKLFTRIAEGVCLDEVLMMVGPTGSGKTSNALQFGALINMPCLRIQCAAETSEGKLFGKTKVRTNKATGKRETIFAKGLIPRAGEHGFFIILDEVDALSPDVRIGLHECLEKDSAGRRKCTIEPDDDDVPGEVVWFNPATRFFLTGNNLGSDMAGLYGGTDSAPNLAFLDRCERINVTYPDADVVSRIIHAKSGGLDVHNCDLIANAVHEVLKAHTTADLPWVFSLRRAITLGHKFKLYADRGLPKSDAVQTVILDNVPVEEVRVDVKGIIQRVGLPVAS